MNQVAYTLWHRILSRLLELILTPLGITVLSEAQVTSNPPKTDILLLRRVGETWTGEQMNYLTCQPLESGVLAAFVRSATAL